MNPEGQAEAIAQALGNGRERRSAQGRWTTFCPVHERDGGDHLPSLDIDVRDGKVLLICRAECPQEVILAELKARGLSLNGNGRAGKLTRYEIRDTEANLIATHCRMDKPGEPKSFWWERSGKNGLQGLPLNSLPLFNSERLHSLPDGARVVVTEGERAARSLADRGVAALGTVTGAKATPDDSVLAELVRFTATLWPDNDPDGRAHMGRIAGRLKALGASPLQINWSGAPPKGDAADFTGSLEDLLRLIDTATAWWLEAEADPPPESESAWPRGQTAVEFCAETAGSDNVDWLVEPIAAPQTVSILASPRGTGKSHVIHAMVVAVACNRTFAGRPTRSGRVLLIDRDNSRREIRRRLRRHGAGRAEQLVILTREEAPALTDKKRWAEFPVDEFDLIVLDALGSATEGVDETAGGESGEAIAPLLDVARQGPAIVVLANTDKLGLKVRGSGVVSDRAEIVYEIRDLTGVNLDPAKDHWTECLPPNAGEEAWLDKNRRRKRRNSYRLAFFPSKFRMDSEIEPFVLEVRVPDEGEWSVADVIHQVEIEHEEAKHSLENSLVEKRQTAVESLRDKIAAGAQISKTAAEDSLHAEGKLKRKEAREELAGALQSGIFEMEQDQKQKGCRGARRGILRLKLNEELL